MNETSVIIPTLNAGPRFGETLEAVREQRGCGEVDLVVVDSESSDGTVERAREAGAHVRSILRSTFNHGLTRNLGVSLARGRFLAFLTQDALPADPHWLAALRDALVSEGAAGAYSRVLPRLDATPLVIRSVEADLVFSTERQVKRASLAEIHGTDPFQRRILFHFNNVASMVDREALRARPFPDIPFGEDLAWAGAMLAAGRALVYEPASRVYHSHESSLLTDFRRHRADARLMRTLFGFRNRESLRGSIQGWWLEVRRDATFLRDRGYSLPARARALGYGVLLRALQVAGQWAGSRGPKPALPRFPAGRPRIEQRPP